MKDSYNVIGVMSGSSLDGLDICLVNFVKNGVWEFNIIKGETYPYSSQWRNKLNEAPGLNTFDFLKLHKEYGSFIGERIQEFLLDVDEDVDLISSHGHTVFHQPEKGITFQIGDGYSIATRTKTTVVSDLRSMDVALGGQGAPMVPIGDMFLFGDYDYCLNMGGFANISYSINDKRIAFDICPVNIVVNHYAREFNQDFDVDGKMAQSGDVSPSLLKELNNINFYKTASPKSLSREWVFEHFIPVVEKYNIRIEDKLRTIYEHIAIQISAVTKLKTNSNILMTGGGAYNRFLIKLIRKMINHQIIIPEETIIDFKEAMIFGFLGLLKFRNEKNCLASVTGASKDCVAGLIYRA